MCPRVAQMELFPLRHVKGEASKSHMIPGTLAGTNRGPELCHNKANEGLTVQVSGISILMADSRPYR